MKHLLALAFLGLLASCAHVNTHITPLVSRKYKGQSYSRILAQAVGTDLKNQADRENHLCLELTKRGARCWRSLDVFPPTEQFTETQRAQALQARAIEGVLAIGMTAAEVSKSFVPPTFKTSCTTGADGSEQCQQVLDSAGYSISKPIGAYRAQLIDVASAGVMWMADLRASGTQYSGFSEVDAASVERVVEELAKLGILRPAEKKTAPAPAN